jgi:hypothetical protein
VPGSTVDDGYLPLPGEVVAADALRLPRARELVELLRGGDLDFVRLVGCRRHAESAVELVVFDVDVELGQRPVHAIRRRERIAATFDPDDTVAPEVQALRAVFPLVPHVNLRAEEFPRSLCLSERPWCELRLGWTAHWLVERTR